MMPLATHLAPPWYCHLERGEAGLRATFQREPAAGYVYYTEAAPEGADAAWLAAALIGLRARLARSDALRVEREARRVATLAAGDVA